MTASSAVGTPLPTVDDMTTTRRTSHLAVVVTALAALVAVPSASAVAGTPPTAAAVTADRHDARQATPDGPRLSCHLYFFRASRALISWGTTLKRSPTTP